MTSHLAPQRTVATQAESTDQPVEKPWFPAGAAVAGVAYAVTAYGYDLGTIEQPGPGALPFLAGAATAVVGATLTVSTLRGRSHRAVDDEDAADGEVTSRFGVAVTLVIAVAVCALMIWQSRIIGLLPAGGVGVAVLSWTLRSRVVTAVLVGLGFYLVTFLLFQQWLEVPLPRGYF